MIRVSGNVDPERLVLVPDLRLIGVHRVLFSTTDRDNWNPPMLRVFDKTTGEVLREIELQPTVHATPMTYLFQGKHNTSLWRLVARGPQRIAHV